MRYLKNGFSKRFVQNYFVAKLIMMFRNLKIRTRMVFLFMILSLIPLLVTVFVFYQQFNSSIQEKISTYSVQVMSQVAQNIKRDLDRLENDSIEIEFSDVVQKTLLRYDSMSEWEVEHAQIGMREEYTKKFYSLRNVSDVLIYTRQGKMINAYGDPGMKLNLTAAYTKDFLQQLHDKDGGVVWDAVNSDNEFYLVKYATSAEQLHRSDGVLLGRAIKSIDTGDRIGYLMIRSSEEYLSDIYKDIDIGAGSKIFVVDTKGTIISSGDPQMRISSHYPDMKLIVELKKQAEAGKRVFDYSIEENENLIAFAPIPGADWFVVGVIPFSYLNSNSQEIYEKTLVIAIACFIAAVFLAYFFAATILAPLQRLRTAMNQARQGDLSVSVKDEYNDEIGEVTQRFNAMLRQIKKLLENIKYKEKQKRRAELKALQSQINPHFLSNTLNTVRFLAKAQNAYNIENITTSLINIFHAMVGSGDDLIGIGEEIEYIKNYLNIQEYQYLNKFNIIYNIEPELLQHRIPKMLLQPIIENALIHGIEPMDGQGTIVLKGYLEDQTVKFVITDNGVGMTKEILATLLNRQTVSNSGLSGIGIANVNERIKMYFGNTYGVSIESELNFYTTVEIILPAIQQGGEHHVSSIDC